MEMRDQDFRVRDEVVSICGGLSAKQGVVTAIDENPDLYFPVTVSYNNGKTTFSRGGQHSAFKVQTLFHRDAVTFDARVRLTAINYDYVKPRAPKVVKKEPHEFQPFEKVLVRDRKFEKWECALFSHRDEDDNAQCIGGHYLYCIPYAGNEHLVGKVTE